jgi:hypothetical protein
MNIGQGQYPQAIHSNDNLLRVFYLGSDGVIRARNADPVLGLYADLVFTDKGRASPDDNISYPSLKRVAHYGGYGFWSAEGDHRFVIISPIEWDMVQAEIARRKTLGRAYSGNSVFSSKLVCGDCGGFYGQKVWHSTDTYRKVIWRCNSKFKGQKKCATPHLDAETIKQKFLIAYNLLMKNRDGVIGDCELIRLAVSDCTALDAEIDRLSEEIEVVAEMVKSCVKENASAAQSQEEYTKKYNALVKRYEKATKRVDELSVERTRKQDRDRELWLFIESIKEQPLVLESWNERLWVGLLEKATVFHDGRMVFEFKNGTEIEVEL